MAASRFAENFYAFRYIDRAFDTILKPLSPEEVALAAIEAKLVAAHQAYLGRQYQIAIRLYTDAEGLIYAQLNPSLPYGFKAVQPGLTLSRDARLFDSLLGASLEWLNVLTVRQPVATVHPRGGVDPGLLSATREAEQVGLLSADLQPGKSMNAAADVQLASSLTNQGNAAAAKFFADRASQTNPDFVGLLRGHADAPVVSPPLRSVARFVPAGGAGVIESAELGTPLLALPPVVTETRSFGSLLGGAMSVVQWNPGDAPPVSDVTKNLYARRIASTDLRALAMVPVLPPDVALRLPHDYYYVIPLALAECNHALGQYEAAETLYFQAAGYQFLNADVEAPYLWTRLATLYLDWGDSLFRQDLPADALPMYQRVLQLDDTAPNSTLYSTPALQPGANAARMVIANLLAIIATPATVTALGVNPLVAGLIADVRRQLIKIQGGLDFWGLFHNSVPIWTFDYLQSVATNFAQLAIGAEHEVINFWEKGDQATISRLQAAQGVSQARQEFQTARMQEAAASAEALAYQQAQSNALQRAANARQNAKDYAALAGAAIVYQAMATQFSGGDNADAGELNRMADELMAGNTLHGVSDPEEARRNMTRSRAAVLAAGQLTASRLNQQYEVNSLGRQADDLDAAAIQAQDETTAASARAAAAATATFAAEMRMSDAEDTLKAFDSLTFPPDVWYRMGNVMNRLYSRYLDMALRAALLMQQAYNFETDQALKLIRSEYSTDASLKGLLGADMLLADIEGFTYALITSRMGKSQPIRQTISLAERHGFAFENQLRKTGTMEFQTTFDDFDMFYPGTFAGRIESVEVTVDGIVPVSGISGTLTNDGISIYRTPSVTPGAPGVSPVKYRVQSKETLVLSDYIPKQDALLFSVDQRMSRVFQGAGVASTWRLDLPKAVNDIDYGALLDVRITFSYKARYDPDLRSAVLAELAGRPSVQARQKGIPLRWVYPDAFFHFQDTGDLNLALQPTDFRHNETKPILTSVGVMVATDGSVPAGGLKLALGTPAGLSVSSQTDPSGSIDSANAASGWAPLAAGSALGNYRLTMTAADNPALVTNGKLVLSPIVNIALILGFSYTPRS